MTTSSSSCTSDYFNFDQLVESEKDVKKFDEEERVAFDLQLLAYLRYHGIISE